MSVKLNEQRGYWLIDTLWPDGVRTRTKMPDGVSSPWEKARAAAGHHRLRIHDMRHAFGIKLAEEGCPMHYISEVMGHHSIDFTRKHYARFSPNSASSPHFSPAFCCGDGSGHVYCVALGRAPRRTVKYACGALRSRALYPCPSAPPRDEIW